MGLEYPDDHLVSIGRKDFSKVLKIRSGSRDPIVQFKLYIDTFVYYIYKYRSKFKPVYFRSHITHTYTFSQQIRQIVCMENVKVKSCSLINDNTKRFRRKIHVGRVNGKFRKERNLEIYKCSLLFWLVQFLYTVCPNSVTKYPYIYIYIILLKLFSSVVCFI